MIIAPDEDAVFTALRSFLQTVLEPGMTGDAGFVVIAGQENRVPEPHVRDYIVFWPLRMPRLSTNFVAPNGLTSSTTQNTECVIQLDIHGPGSFNNAGIISTMFRDGFAVDFFAAIGPAISPLYADDPRQMAFAPGGEQQYEDRYSIDAHLQVNQTITNAAQSATTLTLGSTDVETAPSSWPNSSVTAP